MSFQPGGKNNKICEKDCSIQYDQITSTTHYSILLCPNQTSSEIWGFHLLIVKE